MKTLVDTKIRKKRCDVVKSTWSKISIIKAIFGEILLSKECVAQLTTYIKSKLDKNKMFFMLRIQF